MASKVKVKGAPKQRSSARTMPVHPPAADLSFFGA
jgi:hypothetical protein